MDWLTGLRTSIDNLYIFILCGEALIFALHGWLTGAITKEGKLDVIRASTDNYYFYDT